MSEARFWSLIDGTTTAAADPTEQLEALKEELLKLPTEEIVAFQAEFDRRLQESYRWDLWAVAYIAHGGASDDGFEYFRRWLISRGRDAFERVLANPDDLADVAGEEEMGPDGVMEFEEFYSAGVEAWSEKTGASPQDMPVGLVSVTPEEEPQGEPFPEDEKALAAAYPKTWARFGERPLP